MLKSVWTDAIKKYSRPIETNIDSGKIEIGSGKYDELVPGSIEVFVNPINRGFHSKYYGGDVFIGEQVGFADV